MSFFLLVSTWYYLQSCLLSLKEVLDYTEPESCFVNAWVIHCLQGMSKYYSEKAIRNSKKILKNNERKYKKKDGFCKRTSR